MPAVLEDQRIAVLRSWGASEPLILLSSGVCIHASFRDYCLGPPFYTYHKADPPSGPLFVPLWDYGDSVVGVWQRADRLEFLLYHIEAKKHGEYEMLARTEQGFWANRFDFLYESDVPVDELRTAAVLVGFRYLNQLVDLRENSNTLVSTFEGHISWLQELVAGIDCEAQETDLTM